MAITKYPVPSINHLTFELVWLDATTFPIKKVIDRHITTEPTATKIDFIKEINITIFKNCIAEAPSMITVNNGAIKKTELTHMIVQSIKLFLLISQR